MKMYRVTMDKTITMQLIVEARNPDDARLAGRATMIDTDETAYIRNTEYSWAEVEEVK